MILNEKVEPLSEVETMHLLRRTGFHPSIEQLNQMRGKNAKAIVQMILDDSNNVLPEPTNSMKNWLDKLEEDPLSNLPNDIRFEIEGKLKTRYAEFVNWWLDLMRKDELPYREKFTLFLASIWSIEFTYDTLSLVPPPLLYRNNQTLRSLKFASYKEIAEKITLDGSMLLYQSLFFSGKDAPNENFMRELMELFTMGIGDLETGKSNYTEGDIREGAKALTGWRTVAYLGQEGAPSNRPFETFFDREQHDLQGKKIFQYGEIAPITSEDNNENQVRQKEVKGLIEILFKYRGEQIAKFISDKILKFFVYSNPAYSDIEVVKELADVLINNDFELKPVYEKLFTSSYFYSNEFLGCQIKTPTEFIIGLERILNQDFDSISNGMTRNAVNSLEQVLYDPPDVSSWKGYRSWISTTTYPLRIKYAQDLIEKKTNLELIENFSDFFGADNFAVFFRSIITYLLPGDISQERSNELRDILLNGINKADWINQFNQKSNQCGEGIRKLLHRIILAPDFQLC